MTSMLAIAEEIKKSGITQDLTKVYRPAFTSVEDIAETVHRWGIIVFPAYVQGEKLKNLNAEFDRLIAARRETGFAVDEYDNIANIRMVREKLDAGEFPETSRFFSDPLMTQVADAY